LFLKKLNSGPRQAIQEKEISPVNPTTTGPSFTIAPSIVSNPVNGVSVGSTGNTPLKTVERIPVGGGTCADTNTIPLTATRNLLASILNK